MNEGQPWERYSRPPGAPETGGPGRPWEQYAAPAETSAPAPAPSGIDWADVGKGAIGGLGRGVTGLAGALGDVPGEMAAGLDWVGGKLGLPPPSAQLQEARRAGKGLPTSADIKQAVEGVTGPFYEPKTKAGEYASTIGEFAPAAFVPGAGARRLMPSSIPGLAINARTIPEVIAARTVSTVAPAVASETAGQLTENGPYEPYARGIAAIGGGLAAGRPIPPVAVSPTARAIASGTSGMIGHAIGGPAGAAIGAVAPYAGEQAVRAQRYLAGQVPQSARDVLTQALLQQQISQPSGIERNQAARADAGKRFDEEMRARGLR